MSETAPPNAWATELAREALPAYGLPADTVLRLLKQRENSVFALTHAGTDFVLRVHRQGYHTDAELGRELTFVRTLEHLGLAVPRFRPTTDGANFVHVGAGHPAGTHQVDLQTFIPNSGNFGDEHEAFCGTASTTPDDFEHLGELLARVHNATVESGFAVDAAHPRWDADGLVGDDALWGDPLRAAELHEPARADDLATLTRAIELIRRTLADYGQKPHRFGPIHADLTPENVLRTDDGLVLIDFDDFAAGWHLFDLATALFFYTGHPRIKGFHQALFAGYQRHRRLEAGDFAAFPALLIARGLTYFGWAADRRGEPTAEFLIGEVLPHLVGLARTFLAGSADTSATDTASSETSPTTSNGH